MKQIDNITYIADKGKTFVSINDETVDLGNFIQIGIIYGTDEKDSIENYKEIDKDIFMDANESVTLSFEVSVSNEMNFIKESEL